MTQNPVKDMFLSRTPTDIQRQLTARDFHTGNFPRDTQDKGPTTAPLGPVARATVTSHNHQIFMCSADYAAQDGMQHGSRNVLAAGQFHTFTAAFLPDHWVLYTVKATGSVATDLLYYAVGVSAPSLPYEVLASTIGVGDMRSVPGRGMELTVWTPASNAGAVGLIAKAISSLQSDTVGAINER